MFRRKAKTNAEEQGSPRRQVQRNGGGSPAFSYYTSRVSDGPAREKRTPGRPELPVPEKKGKGNPPVRSFLSALPFWLFVAVAIICVGKVLWLNTDPRIVVVGESSVAANYLQSDATYEAATQKLLSKSITSRTKLTVDVGGTIAALKEEFPELQDVSISLPLVSNRPVVYIQPTNPSMVLQSSHGAYYALSKDGVVLTGLSTVPSSLPIVVDQSGLVPRLGAQVVPSSTVSFVQTVAYQLAAAHLQVSTFVLPGNNPYELDVRLSGKPYIVYIVRFNLEDDALTQSGALIATVQDLGSKVPSSYIDVRVPGRVYYK